MINSKLPKCPGFYWACSDIEEYGYYDLIVNVYGEPPYLQVRVYDVDSTFVSEDGVNIDKMGPKIDHPKLVS